MASVSNDVICAYRGDFDGNTRTYQFCRSYSFSGVSIKILDDTLDCLGVFHHYAPTLKDPRLPQSILDRFYSDYYVRIVHFDKQSFSTRLIKRCKASAEDRLLSRPARAPSSETRVENIYRLVQVLKNEDPNNERYLDCFEIACEMIQFFSEREVKTNEHLQEMALLAGSRNEKIVKTVLKNIIGSLNDFFLEIESLVSLHSALTLVDSEVLDGDDLSNILKFLILKHENLYTLSKSSREYTKLFQILCLISDILDIMGNCNVKLSYEEIHNRLYWTLDTLSNHEVFAIASQAAYARQSLVGIGHDKTQFILLLNSAVHFGRGIYCFQKGLRKISFSSLVESYEHIREALHKQENRKPWYNASRYICAIVVFSDYREFNFVSKIFAECIDSIPLEERSSFLNCLFILLIRQVFEDREKRIQVLDFMKFFFNHWKDDASLKVKRETLLLLSELGKEPRIGVFLSQYHYSNSESSPIIFYSLRTSARNRSMLFDYAKSRVTGYLISKIVKYNVDNQEIRKLRPIFTPQRGSCNETFQETFSLKDRVFRFLEGNKKVLFLVGERSSGKTAFCLSLNDDLSQKRKPDGVVSLFIPSELLTSYTENPIVTRLEGFGFNPDQISQFRRTVEMVVIFDGVPNVHLDRILNGWNAKIVIAYRPEQLPEEIDRSLVETMFIAPFREEEIDIYLKKSLEQVTSTCGWKDYVLYRNYIKKIPGVEKLVSLSPLFLQALIDELPSIAEKHKNSDWKFERIQFDLYEVFMERWFEHAKSDNLQSLEWAKFKMGLEEYCKNLARKMFLERVSEIEYQFLEHGQTNPLEEFFRDNNTTHAAPIRMTGQKKIAFLHPSIQDHYNYKYVNSESLIPNFHTQILVRDSRVIQFYINAIKRVPALRDFFERFVEALDEDETDLSKIISAHNSAFVLFKLNHKNDQKIIFFDKFLEKTFVCLFNVSVPTVLNLSDLYLSPEYMDMSYISYRAIRDDVKHKVFSTEKTSWDILWDVIFNLTKNAFRGE